jgi:hypothetical protein
MARYTGSFVFLLLAWMLAAADVQAGYNAQQQIQQTRDVEQRALPQDVEQRALPARTSREASPSDLSKLYLNPTGYLVLIGFIGVLGFVAYKFYPERL